MIGDGKYRSSGTSRRHREFVDGEPAITGGGVTMKFGTDRLDGDEIFRHVEVKLATIDSEFWWDPRQIERFINIRLSRRGDRGHTPLLGWATFAIIWKQTVLVEAKSSADRPLSKCHIVIFARREIQERGAPNFRGDHPQINLDPILKPDR